jgi:hypothetical protein
VPTDCNGTPVDPGTANGSELWLDDLKDSHQQIEGRCTAPEFTPVSLGVSDLFFLGLGVHTRDDHPYYRLFVPRGRHYLEAPVIAGEVLSAARDGGRVFVVSPVGATEAADIVKVGPITFHKSRRSIVAG